jgi:hypothetical protein
MALVDGRSLPATVLAAEADVTPQAASAQLASLQPIRSLRQSTRAAALRNARTCYDHLAGCLGVQITQALIDHDALIPAVASSRLPQADLTCLGAWMGDGAVTRSSGSPAGAGRGQRR